MYRVFFIDDAHEQAEKKRKKTSDRWLLCTASEFGFFFSFFFLLSSRCLFECIAYHLHIVYTCISLLLPISEFGFFFSFFFLLSSRCLFERIAYHLHIVYTCISLLLPIRCVAAYSSISRKSWLKLMLINSFFLCVGSTDKLIEFWASWSCHTPTPHAKNIMEALVISNVVVVTLPLIFR
jgi:hypothetical protein